MKLVTTVAYILVAGIAEAVKGINHCVRKVLNMF
ncbi:MAG: enhancing lycopene biosynthesis protein 2 [Zhongshania sp.]|jgi:enhancing lycopene biosynthesis protein 2